VLLPSREKSTTFNSVNYHYQQSQEKHRSKKQQKIDKNLLGAPFLEEIKNYHNRRKH
jgi:hypothetical protein